MRGRVALWILLGIASLSGLAFATYGVAAPPAATDLGITKSDSPDPVHVGAILTYTIGIENHGPLAATGVTVTDSLRKGVDFVGATSSSGQCVAKGRKVSCAIGPIPFGGVNYSGAGKVTISLVPRQTGTLTNTASVKGDQKDPVAANNSASATTVVLGPARCRGV